MQGTGHFDQRVQELERWGQQKRFITKTGHKKSGWTDGAEGGAIAAWSGADKAKEVLVGESIQQKPSEHGVKDQNCRIWKQIMRS